MMNRTWLTTVCAKESSRAYLSLPMQFERAGQWYTIATDGMRMVELLGVEGKLSAPPDEIMVGLRKYLAATPAAAVPFDFEALRAFIRQATKGTSSRQVVKVHIGGAQFNARLFVPMARHLPETKSARWYQQSAPAHFPHGPALIDGGEWRFLVMPMLDKGGNEDLPRFEIPGTEAKAA